MLEDREIYKNERAREMQKALVETFYPNAQCHITGSLLTINISFSHKLWVDKYEAQIFYLHKNVFQVFIIRPEISRNINIHMYPDGSLCLWYPPHHPPYFNVCLAVDVIVWIRDWIHNYELYKINDNEWVSEAVPHYMTA